MYHVPCTMSTYVGLYLDDVSVATHGAAQLEIQINLVVTDGTILMVKELKFVVQLLRWIFGMREARCRVFSNLVALRLQIYSI